MSNDEMRQAATGHAAYLAETRQIVDSQTDALFDIVTTILARAGRHDPAARHASISRQDHTLAVTNSPCSEAFTVKVISDLPDSADRMRLFPTSQGGASSRHPMDVRQNGYSGETTRAISYRCTHGCWQGQRRA